MTQDALLRQLKAQANALKPEAVALRRDFHAHPELGFHEYRTSEKVADYLEQLGLEVQRGVGKTGVVGTLRGSKDGKTVLVRADMDALPILEENETSYASKNRGVMHACGHDGHTTIGLMTAKLLAGMRKELVGTIKFAFQPAEEILGGAKAMIAEGVLDNPHVDGCLGLHLWSTSPLGTVSTKTGPLLAAADNLQVKVFGKGGHAAMPHHAVDSVVVAAHVITALQTVVSRSISPLDSAVITFGKIQGGTALNVIPEEVVLDGTVRTFRPSVRETVLRRIREVVNGIATSFGATAEVALEQVCYPTTNDDEMTDLVLETARDLFGEEVILPTDGVMGSEDMSFFLNETPGCFFFIGAGKQSEQNYPHHNPRFDFDEDVLPLGASLMSAAALRYLNGA